MTDIQQAREWAEKYQRHHVIGPEDELAAVEAIRGLPDHWIDAEKVREVLDRWAENPFPTSDEVAVLNDFEALLTPPLPTLAELTPEERKACQWMQADLNVLGDTYRVVILNFVNEWADCMRADGARATQRLEDITPLPDLPKLEWPGSHADTITAESVEDVQAGRVADFEPALPRPEDVPAGEPWTAKCAGFEGEWIGTRSSNPDRNYPWMLTNPQTQEREVVQDSKVTLISRLVPEVKP